MQVIDRQTGQPIELPDEQVQAAFQSGKIALPPTSRIPVQRGTGEIGTVSAQDLDKELAAGGQVVPQAVVDKAALEAKAGGIGGAAATAVPALISGATGGLSDVAAAKLGGEGTRQWLQEHYAANPGTKVAGQVAGALLPTIATGGEAAPLEASALTGAREGAGLLEASADLGAAARAAEQQSAVGTAARGLYSGITAPARLTAEAGKFAERAVGAVVGDNSPSLLARTAQSLLAKGGAGAVEGAITTIGNQLSEDALGDTDTTAQKLFAAAGHGAIFGAELGGGLGAASELGGAAFSKIAKSETLQKLSENQMWRALNPTKAATKDADMYIPGGHRSIGKQLLDDEVGTKGDTIETLQPKIHAAKLAAYDEQGTVLSQLTNAGAKGVDWDALQASIEKDIPPIIKKLGETTEEARAIDQQVKQLAMLATDTAGGDIGVTGRIPLQDLNAFRRRLDDHINFEQAKQIVKGETPLTRTLKMIRGKVEDAFMKQADAEASRLFGSQAGAWEKAWKAAKTKTQRYIVADRTATQAVAGMYSNQSMSLTDKMAGYAAGAAMLGGHIAAGGAGIPGHVARVGLGLTGAVASKFIREHGNTTVAIALRNLRDLGAAQQVAKRFDLRAAKAIGKAIHGHPYKGQPVDLDDYDSVAARVKAARDAATHQQAVASHLGSLQETAPKLSGAFGSAVRRATLLLASKLPPENVHPLGREVPPTAAQKSELLRTERAIKDPLVMFQDMRAGTLTNDTVQTIKQVNPALFGQLQMEVAKQLKKDDSIPYARKLQMARIMGIDLDGTLDPNFVAAMQAQYSAAATSKPSNGNGPHKAAKMGKAWSPAMALDSRLNFKELKDFK